MILVSVDLHTQRNGEKIAINPDVQISLFSETVE